MNSILKLAEKIIKKFSNKICVHRQGQSGFTLIEVLVAMIILSFVVTAGYGLINSSNSIVSRQTGLTDMRNDLRIALIQMTKDIQQSESVIGTGTPGAPYSFIQSGGNIISYSHNDSTNKVIRHDDAKQSTLIESVEAFTINSIYADEQFEINVTVNGEEHSLLVTRRIKGNVLDVNYGTIRGLVRSSIHPNPLIENAVVVAKNVDTNTEYWFLTGANGEYSLNLPAGEYEVRASKTGYTNYLHSHTITIENLRVEDVDLYLIPITLPSNGIPPNIQYLLDNEFALFAALGTGNTSNPALKMEGSTCISGTVGTNAQGSNSVKFEWSTRINNGNLYIGAGANKDNVVTSPRSNYNEHISNGVVQSLPENKMFDMPAFPDFPTGLQIKGSLKTNQGEISGRVYDANGNPLGDVSIYVGPSTDTKFRASVQTTNNPDWVDGHGKYSFSTGDQMGSVRVMPARKGYRFEPEYRIVTGPVSNLNFVAISDSSVPQVNIPLSSIPEWTWLIDQDGQYDTIEVTSGRRLTFDLGGGDRIIRVRNLNISQGFIELQNTGSNGRLFLYVENNISLGGSSTINNDGNFNQVYIYYAGNNEINFGGNTRLKGNIFIEKAPLTIGNSGGVQGHIVTGGTSVSISGNADANARLLYAPNAKVSISGSGKVVGTVVGNSIHTSGGSCPAIQFVPIDTNAFPSVFFQD